ncbi:MAG TPA: PEP-CTERM sorting domain-containing protein, partial [Terriglobales bacterium]
DVYLFDYGSVTFGSSTPGSSTGDPIFDNSGTFSGMFPTGTELYSFIDGPGAGEAQDGTALSSAIIVVGHAVVPDPASLTLMLSGGALVGLATLRQRFRG